MPSKLHFNIANYLFVAPAFRNTVKTMHLYLYLKHKVIHSPPIKMPRTSG